MIGAEHEKEWLYYLDFVSKPMACTNYVSLLNYHYRLGHPSISILKVLVFESSQTESLKCASCQLGKHHRVSYPNRVNKRVNYTFDLVHSNVEGPCSIKSKVVFKYFIFLWRITCVLLGFFSLILFWGFSYISEYLFWD